MSNKQKYNPVYMNAAVGISKMSHATRLKVGCAVVKDNRIIALSYNGTPKGTSNDCENHLEDGKTVTKVEVIHAEENALIQVAKSNESVVGADMFITHAPCLQCASRIKQAEINKVYFREHYRDTNGIEYLLANGIEVEELKYE